MSSIRLMHIKSVLKSYFYVSTIKIFRSTIYNGIKIYSDKFSETRFDASKSITTGYLTAYFKIYMEMQKKSWKTWRRKHVGLERSYSVAQDREKNIV